MVEVGSDSFAIPLNTIEGIVQLNPYELEVYYEPDAPAFNYAGQPYKMRYLGTLLHSSERPDLTGRAEPVPVLLVRAGVHAVAVQVDKLLASREIVVKTLGPQFNMVQGLSGATVLGDGSVIVILDLLAMVREDASHMHRDFIVPSTREETDSKQEQNPLVMVVDDSVTVRKVTSRFLEREGMDVIVAKDGADAMLVLQDKVPDVMLLDIEMPRLDGFEVAHKMSLDDRLKQIPIIMITSRTGEKHRQRALDLGVNRYMGKPYNELELLQSIRELLDDA
jgi:chemosensory pili system protein ChpA (sensor histidine kinase/response regulator)